jgi:hypothetical protein
MSNLELTPFLDRPLQDNGPIRALIPDGSYKAQIKSWRTFRYMGEPRVEFTFEIRQGEYTNTQIGFFTGVKSIIGKEAINGEFIPAGRQSNLGKAVRLAEQLIGNKPTIRSLLNVIWEVQVITIKQDAQRQPLRDEDMYSKITRIIPASLEIDW